MRHSGWFLAVLGLFLLIPVLPFDADASAAENESEATADVDAGWLRAAVSLSGGYRIDSLAWSIAGNRLGTNPNVLSELTWSDVQIYQTTLKARGVIRDRICLNGSVGYGIVLDGDNRDSDYAGDNRTLEYSRSENGVDGNDVWDATVGIGPLLAFHGDRLTITPLVGYGISRQDLNIVDGYQTLASPTTPVGPIDGLNSRYEATWKGPWIGIDMAFRKPVIAGPFTEFGFLLSAAYHWVDYAADANWNLRGDYQHPCSFSHDADGDGITLAAEISMQTAKRWGLRLGIDMTRMRTNAGEDRLFLTDGTVESIRLNEVEWQSVTVDAGLTWEF